MFTLNIVFGARNGRVRCCSKSAALATARPDGASPATAPAVSTSDFSGECDAGCLDRFLGPIVHGARSSVIVGIVEVSARMNNR